MCNTIIFHGEVCVHLCQDRAGEGGRVLTLEKMKKSIFKYRDEEKKLAIKMGKLGSHFLKWEQLKIN